jgi:peptidoglycan/xylan/chitin deacetylase (PgdA/CDA1 family)
MSQRVFNLTFHGIGTPQRELEPGEDELWVSEKRFAALLDAVSDDGTVRLHFDDGNASDIDIALPALLERGLRANFFVITDRLGSHGYLSPATLRSLAEAGMPIGVHGRSHLPWRSLSRGRLAADLSTAMATIEELLDLPVTAAACPLGSYDRRVLRQLRSAGFHRVYTSDGGWARSGSWLQARYSVRTQDDATSLARRLADDGTPARALRAGKRVVKRLR